MAAGALAPHITGAAAIASTGRGARADLLACYVEGAQFMMRFMNWSNMGTVRKSKSLSAYDLAFTI